MLVLVTIHAHDDWTTYRLVVAAGTGYDDVRIKDVLQMSSGVGFNEDYYSFWSGTSRSSVCSTLNFEL